MGLKVLPGLGKEKRGTKTSHDFVVVRFVTHYLGLPLPGSPLGFPPSHHLSTKKETGPHPSGEGRGSCRRAEAFRVVVGLAASSLGFPHRRLARRVVVWLAALSFGWPRQRLVCPIEVGLPASRLGLLPRCWACRVDVGLMGLMVSSVLGARRE